MRCVALPMHHGRWGVTRYGHSERPNEMERMLVVVFDSEGKADEASEMLKRLHEENIITLYAEAVVRKDPDGLTTVRKTHHAIPEGTMGGTALGTFIGL